MSLISNSFYFKFLMAFFFKKKEKRKGFSRPSERKKTFSDRKLEIYICVIEDIAYIYIYIFICRNRPNC